MFKRKIPLTWLQSFSRFFWPKGGWRRAASYVWHRLRRLPDSPHRIARGIACGVWVCFTPLFGLHFLVAALLALIIRGNVVAALLATFVGNPVTFPFIAATSLHIGNFVMGIDERLPMGRIFVALGQATAEIPRNVAAIFTQDVMQWGAVGFFYDHVFWPYLIGGLIPGLVAAIISYYLTFPIVAAYQNRRRKKIRKKFEAMHERAKNLADE